MGFEYTFEDNSDEAAAAIKRAIAAGLEEAGGEFESQAKRNSRVDTGDTKASFSHAIEGDTVYIGSNAENAVWEEFGTGIYAEKGGGSGYWVFVKGESGTKRSGKRYTLQKAKQIMAMLRKDGLEAYYTNGKRGTRALTKAGSDKAAAAQRIMEEKLRGLGK